MGYKNQDGRFDDSSSSSKYPGGWDSESLAAWWSDPSGRPEDTRREPYLFGQCAEWFQMYVEGIFGENRVYLEPKNRCQNYKSPAGSILALQACQYLFTHKEEESFGDYANVDRSVVEKIMTAASKREQMLREKGFLQTVDARTAIPEVWRQLSAERPCG